MNLDFTNLVLTAFAVLITLTVHEYCHGYAAYKMGDNTAKNLGRLTLNPIPHIDPIGALCMLLFHFGWAKPVPINPRNFKNPKKGFAITALAGPLSNLFLGFIFSGVLLLLIAIFDGVAFESEFAYNIVFYSIEFIKILYAVNIGIAIFNLIPIPPLDGSRLLTVILPERLYFKIMRYERVIYFVMIGWLLVGDFVARAVRSIPFIASNPTLYSLSAIFSLSELLGYAILFVSNLFLDFWQLIPFLRL